MNFPTVFYLPMMRGLEANVALHLYSS